MRKKVIISLTIFLVAGLLFAHHSISAPAQKVTIATGQEPTSTDPSLVYVGADYITVNNYAERFIERAPNGDLIPAVATSWKVSEDGKTMDFMLRKGVKFHSGDLMTAEDVVFSFKRGMEKNSSIKSRCKLVTKVEAVNDYHIRLHFKSPDVVFIPNGGSPFIVSKKYYDRVGEDKFVQEPVGTAAYKFVKYSPGEYLDLERFEDYWGEKPSVKEARFIFITEDTTAVSKLKTGEVDMLGAVPYTAVKDLEANPGIKIVKSVAGHPTPLIAFNTFNPNLPWADKRVRLAMAHAINYDAIRNDLLMGIPPRYAYLAPYELGYDPELKPHEYNPEKSKKLLAEAGFAKGFDLPLYYLMTNRVPMIRETVELIASYFEAVGIRTTLKGQEAGAYYSTRRKEKAKGDKGNFVSLASAGCIAGGVECSYFMYMLLRTDAGFSQYNNPEMDKLIDSARSMLDEKKRAEIVKKAQRLILAEAPAFPIYNYVPMYAMKKNIDFKPTEGYPFTLVMVKNITIH
ncbi:ABC transporter substrate-binding protein [Thermodesulfobacteriota bacterium]